MHRICNAADHDKMDRIYIFEEKVEQQFNEENASSRRKWFVDK